jgi:serine/threonine protein kinase|nr:serine/threonine-protein kinase [Kofleriaceae bacterium]
MSRTMGRYELVRPIARGGMAEVYLARRRAAGVEKWLVVKRIRAERASDARFLEMFVREARLSMSLVHQNIVPVFDFGRSDDQVFLAMERVEGKDLGASVARAGAARLPPLVAAWLAAECCQALDYAHQRKSPDGAALGIVHRDVTPRNVLLSWSGEVKLTDFGIASLGADAVGATSATAASVAGGNAAGTPAYMAPEQAAGERVDHRADLYALGLVLREALTGDRARARGEREATLALAKTGALLPWPDDIAVPAALRAIVERATAVSPDARFADARAMLAELDAVIVAERAAKRGDAPARQLADWLKATWAGEADEPAPGDGAVEVGDLMSFVDDDAGLGVIGTGTERSMASTAAEGPAPSPPPPAAKQKPPQSPELSPAALARSKRGVAAIVIAVGVIGVVAIAAREYLERIGEDRLAFSPDDDSDGDDGDGQLAATAQASSRDDVQRAAAPVEPPAVAPVPPVPPPPVQPLQPHTTAANATPPAAPKPQRHVTINSQPWSNFTVDADPAVHQTIETLTLPAGPHTIHFSNPELHLQATATIDVPPDRDIRFVQPLK